jgi:hypothetical protein
MGVVHSESANNHGCSHSQASWRQMLPAPLTHSKHCHISLNYGKIVV